jgi:gamma-glutamyltranspeptidase/glutathione hydrolase
MVSGRAWHSGTVARWQVKTVWLLVLVAACVPSRPSRLEPPAEWRHRVAQQPATGTRAMIVSQHVLASGAGLGVLRRGGNAIDAAVAVGFALAVVYPGAGNIGGGGFLLYRSADGQVFALDYRERAPGSATRGMFLDSSGNVSNRSLLGALAAGVPGSVAGMWEMHQRFGSLPWADVVAPAIVLAEGHVLDSGLARGLNNQRRRFAQFPSSAAAFVRDGEWRYGDTLRQPDLARTLRRIAALGRAGFYEGETARLVAEEMRRSGGIITEADLAAYQPRWRTPLSTMYRGHQVLTMPPVSGGGTTLIQALNILSGFRMPAFGSAAQQHLMIESLRRAFADRNRYIGDPDFVAVPLARLTSMAYADSQRATIRRDRATPAGDTPLAEGSHTTHYTVTDPGGNIASVTTTLNTGYGSKLVVGGAGFLLNNEMDDFTTLPGTVNAMGIRHIGEANTIVPGKRMLSSMTPTIVLDPAGRPELALGAEGGAHIISAVLAVISGVIDHGMSLAEALHAPRVHHNALPDSVGWETDGMRPEVRRALESMGHVFETEANWAGSVQAIRWTRNGLEGVSDPRAGRAAIGW